MDKKKLSILLVFVLVIAILFAAIVIVLIVRSHSVSDRAIIIHGDNHNPANLMQINSSVAMGTDGKELFFYTGKPGNTGNNSTSTSFSGTLAVFRDKTVKKLDIPGAIIAIDNGYCYYFLYQNGTKTLYAMNLSDAKVSEIHGPSENHPYLQNVTSDGKLLYQDFEMRTEGYPLIGDSLGDRTEVHFAVASAEYSLDELSDQYYCCYMKQVGDTTTRAVQQFYDRHYQFMLPQKDGLLLIDVQNPKALFRIGNDGTAELLFSLSCGAMDCAFNLQGDTAYLSCKCYAAAGDRNQLNMEGLVPYKNGEKDPSGTYQVNLKTGEVTKICDNVYTGLYIFDDSGIYACDQSGRIFLLDFDGNTVDTLVK